MREKNTVANNREEAKATRRAQRQKLLPVSGSRRQLQLAALH